MGVFKWNWSREIQAFAVDLYQLLWNWKQLGLPADYRITIINEVDEPEGNPHVKCPEEYPKFLRAHNPFSAIRDASVKIFERVKNAIEGTVENENVVQVITFLRRSTKTKDVVKDRIRIERGALAV